MGVQLFEEAGGRGRVKETHNDNGRPNQYPAFTEIMKDYETEDIRVKAQDMPSESG